MQWNEPKGDEERRMGRFVCAFTDEGRRDEGINSVVRISLRDMLSPFFSFAEAIISRGLPSPVERRAARCMRAIRGEKKKKGKGSRAFVCPTFLTGRWPLLVVVRVYVFTRPCSSFFSFFHRPSIRGIDVDSPRSIGRIFSDCSKFFTRKWIVGNESSLRLE